MINTQSGESAWAASKDAAIRANAPESRSRSSSASPRAIPALASPQSLSHQRQLS